ncbi:MAG: hypothetical protein ACYCSG_00710 [Thermoplasmataceae archaeon]
MRLEFKIALISGTILLSFSLAFFIHDLVLSFIPMIFLYPFKKKYSMPSGLVIGFTSFFAVYFQYNFGDVARLSNIIGSIIGIPGILVLLIYPLLSGIIAAFGALLWSSCFDIIRGRRVEMNTRAETPEAK